MCTCCQSNTCEFEKAVDSLLTQLNEQQQEIDRLKMLTDLDDMTGIFNRRRFLDDLDRTIKYNTRYNRTSCLVFIDINEMKHINDDHGHVAGDNAIKHVATKIKHFIRSTDGIYRYGGDEFVIIMNEVTEDIAIQKLQSLKTEIKNDLFTFNDISKSIHISFGFEMLTPEVLLEDIEKIIIQADKKMYESKRASHSTV